MTLCMLCSMRAMVEGKKAPTFNEDPVAHVQQWHPNLLAAEEEKRELTARLAEMLGPEFNSPHSKRIG